MNQHFFLFRFRCDTPKKDLVDNSESGSNKGPDIIPLSIDPDDISSFQPKSSNCPLNLMINILIGVAAVFVEEGVFVIQVKRQTWRKCKKGN
ncbi:UNVERIFIED_CONTAM: hypothetical protein NCL1_47996 [Trichonephila clavipes]